MALIKYGGGIIQMSGSIAGNTYARNRYGNYVRARTKPVNPNTDRQVAVRAALAFLTTAWSTTLTDANRIGWNLYGASVAMKNRLGETVFLTGFNHYIRSNLQLKVLAQGLKNAPPVIFELPAQDPLFSITLSEATQQVTVTYDAAGAWANETGGYLWYYQGKPQNPQRNFFAGPWRFCSSVLGVTGAPPASPDVKNVVFAVSELQRDWFYARIQRLDGRISEPFSADTFCAA